MGIVPGQGGWYPEPDSQVDPIDESPSSNSDSQTSSYYRPLTEAELAVQKREQRHKLLKYLAIGFAGIIAIVLGSIFGISLMDVFEAAFNIVTWAIVIAILVIVTLKFFSG